MVIKINRNKCMSCGGIKKIFRRSMCTSCYEVYKDENFKKERCAICGGLNRMGNFPICKNCLQRINRKLGKRKCKDCRLIKKIKKLGRCKRCYGNYLDERQLGVVCTICGMAKPFRRMRKRNKRSKRICISCYLVNRPEKAIIRNVRNETFCKICGKQPIHWHRFEHEDNNNKRIHRMVEGGRNIIDILVEISKCTPLCVPCHCRVHTVTRELEKVDMKLSKQYIRALKRSWLI